MKNILIALCCLGSSFQTIAQLAYTSKSFVSLKHSPVEMKKAIVDSKVIPFQLLGGLIMVDTEIEGIESSCIFDTGAPSVIINKDKDSIKHADSYGVGVNGKMKMKSIVVSNFAMGNIKKKNLRGMEVDISHIEKIKKQAIQGIIGVDAYIEQEVLIDYKQEELLLMPRKKMKRVGNKKKIASVSFFMEEQLPVIRVKIGNKHYYFGVDTGAEVNVINKRCIKKLKRSKIDLEETKLMAGVSNRKNLASTTKIKRLKIKNQSFQDIEFVFLDLDQFNTSHGMQIDGILGFPFLKENLVSLDFRRSKLNFWIKDKDQEIEDPIENVAMTDLISKK